MLSAKLRNNVAHFLFVISFLCLVSPTKAELSGTSGLIEDQGIQLREKGIFACRLDQWLSSYKGVAAEDVKTVLASGAGDDEIVAWFNKHGTPKSANEIKTWSDSVEAARPYDDPEKREWFAGECAALGLDPAKATWVEYLETDDRKCSNK